MTENNSQKFVAVGKDNGEEITGYLIRCEGSINKDRVYICPEASTVEFSGVDENNAPRLAIGPFYEVIEDTLVPALPDDQAEAYEELKAYRKSCVYPDALQQIVQILHFLDLNDPDEVKAWVERAQWHVKRCDELGEENRKLKCELAANNILELKKLKLTVANRMGYENARRIEKLNRLGAGAVTMNAKSIALNSAIIDVFVECDLQLRQIKVLYAYSEHKSLLEKICKELSKTPKIAYGENDIKDAIFNVVSELDV